MSKLKTMIPVASLLVLSITTVVHAETSKAPDKAAKTTSAKMAMPTEGKCGGHMKAGEGKCGAKAGKPAPAPKAMNGKK